MKKMLLVCAVALFAFACKSSAPAETAEGTTETTEQVAACPDKVEDSAKCCKKDSAACADKKGKKECCKKEKKCSKEDGEKK